MRVLYSWLREFVPIDVDAVELAEKLSTSGLAVDELHRVGAGIAGIVVGEVRAMREHPNADSLMLVKAFDGERERDIVCGARNYVVGDRVPLAIPGSRLPSGMEIGQRKVRGEVSEGMLCSARELEISDDHSGILILDPDAPLGKDLVDALGLDDTLFVFDVMPNRPDCLSVIGIAREIAAIYGLPMTIPVPALVEEDVDAASVVRITIEDADGCPRYLARVITDVRIGPSPWWMRRRLYAAGMRPISNIVDVTNYVMLERGQPLHAFDLDTIRGGEIIVRRPATGESIATLDGQTRALVPADVLICDADHPVAIAGVMGGAETEVSGVTTSIVLESAYFDPLRIRPTSRRLGLRSEASLRFERGTDPDGVPAAAARAAQLFADLAGGRVARGAVDVYPSPIVRAPVRLHIGRAERRIGAAIDAAQVQRDLEALGCDVATLEDSVVATPPSWRHDIAIEEDLIEEVARLYGYDRIPETLPPGARVGGLTAGQSLRRRIRGVLLGAGLSEAQTLSLLPPSLPDKLGLPAEHPLRNVVRLANPLSEEESVLRPSILPGLLLSAQRNAARRVLPVMLFEMGTVFRRGDHGPHEEYALGWVLTGEAPEGWHRPGRALDFFDAKGVLETLLDSLGISDWSVREADADEAAGLMHPGRKAVVVIAGEVAGVVGELHPRAADGLELPERVAVGALLTQVLSEHATPGRAPELSRYPTVQRDIALIVPEAVAAATVADAVRAAAGEYLETVALFDVYRGDQVPPGSVSLAYALAFRHPERTLTDEDADAAMAGIAERATREGWTIRT